MATGGATCKQPWALGAPTQRAPVTDPVYTERSLQRIRRLARRLKQNFTVQKDPKQLFFLVVPVLVNNILNVMVNR